MAAVAHVFVFSVEPYRYVPASSDILNVTTEKKSTEIKLEEGISKEKSAMLEKMEMKVEAPGTSVTESVQDIIVEGGQRVRSLLPYACLVYKFRPVVADCSCPGAGGEGCCADNQPSDRTSGEGCDKDTGENPSQAGIRW